MKLPTQRITSISISDADDGLMRTVLTADDTGYKPMTITIEAIIAATDSLGELQARALRQTAAFCESLARLVQTP